jgi:hypothetical protein
MVHQCPFTQNMDKQEYYKFHEVDIHVLTFIFEIPHD